MKRNRKKLLILFSICVMLLTACSPILKSFDPFSVQLDYRVPKKPTHPVDMEIEAQLKKLVATVDRNKYDAVDGKDAYYLLPAGVPLPEGLIDFQSIGMLDENTTCYAYQALYAKDDTAGLGDMPLEGKAAPFDDIQESPDNIHYLVTFLMTYNTESRTYRVLYHTIEEAVASYVVTEDEDAKQDESVVAKRLRVSKASALPAGKSATDDLTSEEIAQLPLCEKIYLRKLNKESFWFYHDGCGYRYDLNGQLQLKQDLNNYLQQITYQYGPRGIFETHKSNLQEFMEYSWLSAGDVYSISDMAVDENGCVYIQLCMTKKEINIRGGVDEDKMPDPEKDMTQIYCRIYSVDVGSYIGEDGTEKNDFRSLNQNYQKAVDEWMEADGQTYTFAAKPTESKIEEALGSEKSLKKKYPETYGGFQFSRPQFPAELEYGKVSIVNTDDGKRSSVIQKQALNPAQMKSLINQKDQIEKQESKWLFSEYLITGFYVSLPEQVFVFEKKTLPQQYSAVNRVHRRTFTALYPVTETGADGSKTEHMEEETITETAIFTEAMSAVFPKNTNVFYAMESKQDTSLAQSSAGGVIEYTQYYYNPETDPLGHNTAKITWGRMEVQNASGSTDSSGTKYMSETTEIPDALKSLVMVESLNQPDAPPMIVASGQLGLYFTNRWKLNDQKTMWDMRGISHDEMAKDEINQLAGYNYDVSRIIYLENKGKDWLYLADPDTGIVKINVSLGDPCDDLQSAGNKIGRLSQISPYPCFGIYSDASGNVGREITFQTMDYTYQETDQFRAKICEISFTGQESELNQVSTIIDRNQDLQKSLQSELNQSKNTSADLPSFTNVLQNMGIKDGKASHIQSYRSYMVREIRKRMAARKQLVMLAGMPVNDDIPIYVFEIFHTMAGNLKSAEDVENLIISLRMAKYALDSRQSTADEEKKKFKEEIKSELYEQIGSNQKNLEVDFSYENYKDYLYEHEDFLKGGYSSGRVSGKEFHLMGHVRYSPNTIFENYSLDVGEIEKTADYITQNADIQTRILNGENQVWNEIYTACGLNKEEIRIRNKDDYPKLPWIGDYEDYIRERVKLYQRAKAPKQATAEELGQEFNKRMQPIIEDMDVGFSYNRFEEYLSTQESFTRGGYSSGLVSGTPFQLPGHIRYSPKALYHTYSKDYEEIKKVASYVAMDDNIQTRILNNDGTVWNDIYMACGLNKEQILTRNQNDSPKVPSVQTYEDYIRESVKKYQSARDTILSYAGMSVKNPEATELSAADADQARAKAFFVSLIGKDLPMQEADLVNGAAVENLVVSLCRKWSGIEDIDTKSNAEIAKMRQGALGYSDRVWKRMLTEVKTDLQPDFSRKGYDSRGNFDIRRVADYMEDSWYEAAENAEATEAAHKIKNPGELLLETLRKSNQPVETAEPSGSEWKLVLVNAGMSEPSDSNRLTDYYRYLLNEMQDRQNVSTTVQKLSGYHIPETMDIENRYDQCNSAEDVQSLLCALYAERPDIKKFFTGTEKTDKGETAKTGTGEEETGAEGSDKEDASLSMEEMVTQMRSQNNMTADQWSKQMDTLLSQMKVQVDYESFISREKSQKEQQALAVLMNNRTKREKDVKDYQFYKEAYGLAEKLLKKDLSADAFVKETKSDINFYTYYGDYRYAINRLGKILLEDPDAQTILCKYTWGDVKFDALWLITFRRVSDSWTVDYIQLKEYNKIRPLTLQYVEFCKKTAQDWQQAHLRLLELFNLDESEVTDKTAFYKQVEQQAAEWRNTH